MEEFGSAGEEVNLHSETLGIFQGIFHLFRIACADVGDTVPDEVVHGFAENRISGRNALVPPSGTGRYRRQLH